MTRPQPLSAPQLPDFGAAPFAMLDPTQGLMASQRLVAAMAEANAHALTGARRMQDQWMRFLSARLDDDMAAMRELAECRSLPEFMAVGMKFWERAARQYAEEAEVIAAETADQARESAEDLRREAAAVAGATDSARAAA